MTAAAITAGAAADKMLAEGRILAKLAPHIALNVPLFWADLWTCKIRIDEGQAVNVTLLLRRSGAAGGPGGLDVHLALQGE